MDKLVHIFSHLTEPEILAQYSEYLIVVVLISSFIEVVFPPIPGDTVLVISGSIAAAAHSNPIYLVMAAFFGTFAASFLLYRLGVKMGKKLLQSPKFSWMLDSKTFLKIEQGFNRHGFLIIVLSRFLPVARSGVALAAGMVRLEQRRSLAALAVSILLSALVFVYGGLFLGRRINIIMKFWENQSELVLLSALFAVILLLAVLQWIKYQRQKKEK